MSKMPVSRHLGFYQIVFSAIRSAFPETPSLEPNMEWFGCTVCEIFVFKLVYCDLETGVRGHWRSSKAALFDRAHTTLYSSSIVNMPLSVFICYRFRDIAAYWSKIANPLVFGTPFRGEASDLRKKPWSGKTRMMSLSDSERISMICSVVWIQSTHVTDRRTEFL